MMQETMNQNEAIDILKEAKEEIPNYRVYFTLKLMKLKPLQVITVEYVKACLALHRFNLPITVDLVKKIMDRKAEPYSQLHTLGDKNVLTYKRGKKGKQIEWIVSPTFLKYYEGETE